MRLSRPVFALVLAAATALVATAPRLATAQAVELPAPIAELRTLIRAGELELAIEKGESLVEHGDDNALAWLWLGRAYGQQALRANVFAKAGWAGKCREAFEKAVELDGSSADARWDLMQYYLQAPGFMGGGVDKARSQAQAIAAIDPALGYLAEAGIAAREEVSPESLEALYRKAVAAAKPAENRPRLALSSLFTRQQRWDDLFAFWQGQIDANPGDAVALFQFARAAALSGRELERGLERIDTVLALEPTPPELSVAALHWRRGLILEHLERREDAVKALRQAVSLDGDAGQTEAKKDLERLGG